MARTAAAQMVRLALVLLVGGCAHAGVTPPPPQPAHENTAAVPEAVRASVHATLGVPRDADDSDDLWLDRGVYVMSYNPRLNVANWVSWQVQESDLGEAARRDHFHADEALPPGVYAVKPNDYSHSGFDRGHLCPSAERTRTSADNAQTFAMSNVHPQDAALNQHSWKALESYERELVTRAHMRLFVIAGGLFSPRAITIGPAITVPEYEFRIVVALSANESPAHISARTSLIAVLVPNDARAKQQPWQAFSVSVAEIEARTGYDFLSNLPDDVESALEHTTQPTLH